MSGYLQAAFEKVCPDFKEPESWYVVLTESIPYYGGPEEGGWWGRDTVVVAFREYTTQAMAKTAAEAIQKLAKELSHEAKMNHGKQCLHEMEWLEARGLEADWLPEPDGPSEFYVSVMDTIPEGTKGCRHYE